MSPKNFFTREEQLSIRNAIAIAEKSTSGEIRVHLEGDCKEDVLDRASKVFFKLKMDKTKLRNGVLFYVAVNHRKLAIIGDKGINEKVPPGFWDQVRDVLLEHFKNRNYALGLCLGIELSGEKLRTHFPLQKNDSNELTNEVSYSS